MGRDNKAEGTKAIRNLLSQWLVSGFEKCSWKPLPIELSHSLTATLAPPAIQIQLQDLASVVVADIVILQSTVYI